MPLVSIKCRDKRVNSAIIFTKGSMHSQCSFNMKKRTALVSEGSKEQYQGPFDFPLGISLWSGRCGFFELGVFQFIISTLPIVIIHKVILPDYLVSEDSKRLSS